MTDRERLIGGLTDDNCHLLWMQGDVCNLVDYLMKIGVTFQTWIPGKKPPKEWKDEKGDAINYLAVIPGVGVDIANWIEPTRCWFCMGMPCKVTHWMSLPEPPKEE